MISLLPRIARKSIPRQGLRFWLDCLDARAIVTSSAKVIRVYDKSPMMFNFEQTVLANQPSYSATGINGHPAIVFPSINHTQHLVSTATQSGFALSGGLTVYVVYVHAAAYGFHESIWRQNPGTSSQSLGITATALASTCVPGTDCWGDRGVRASSPTPISGVLSVQIENWQTHRSSSLTRTRITHNGSSITIDAYGSYDPISLPSALCYIGGYPDSGAYGYRGAIGEIILYNQRHDDIITANVVAHLRRRWGF